VKLTPPRLDKNFLVLADLGSSSAAQHRADAAALEAAVLDLNWDPTKVRCLKYPRLFLTGILVGFL